MSSAASPVIGPSRPGRPGRGARRASRVLSVVAAVWTVAFAVGYVLVVEHQTDPAVAWWFVATLAVAAAAALVSTFTAGWRVVLAVTAGVLAVCALLGMLSVGPLLVPAVVLAVVAAALPAPGPAPAR